MELGSEFSLGLNNLEIIHHNLFDFFGKYNIEWFDYGRSALRSVPVDYTKKILVPEFICESVVQCFPKEQIVFYKINDRLDIDENDLFDKWDAQVGTVYICHYFGFIQNKSLVKRVREKAEQDNCIFIEDLTQSLFSSYIPQGDYMIASIRKWMPIPQGGVLFSHTSISLPDTTHVPQSKDNTRAYGMILKDMFLNMDYDANSKYREIFRECEEKIDSDENIRTISSFAKYLISCQDVSALMQKRRMNFERLEWGISKLGLAPIRSLRDKEVPLVYPIRIKQRDKFREYLMENNIYCAVHWPFYNIQPEVRINAKYNADTLLSLPIDQRYGSEEIDYMIDVIQQYGGEVIF